MNTSISSNEKFVRREISVLIKKGDDYIPEKRIIIGITAGKIIIPHPITDFIDKTYYLKSGSINNEKAAADVLVQFLNFVLEQKKNMHSVFIKVNGIIDLELEHLEKYLEYCGEIGNSRKTVERKEYYLLTFFYFIGIEKKRLKVKPEININMSVAQYKAGGKKRIKKLHANLYYKKPKKELISTVKKKDLITQQWADLDEKKNIRFQFIREFLLLASKEFPNIAFVICLQIFGGLRSAECMNLTINSIKTFNKTKYGERGMIVEVRDRQIELFQSDSLLSNDQVKKLRDQAILLDPLVPYLYKKHLEWLDTKKKSLEIKNFFPSKIALFLNDSGKPMKTHTYRTQFNNLKNFYLGILNNTEGRYEDFKEFRNTKWSTHICRGTFTNMCLEAGFNATQTAILRGDSSPDAMYDYIDVLTTSNKISKAIDIISTESISSISRFKNEDYINTWEEVVKFADRD